MLLSQVNCEYIALPGSVNVVYKDTTPTRSTVEYKLYLNKPGRVVPSTRRRSISSQSNSVKAGKYKYKYYLRIIQYTISIYILYLTHTYAFFCSNASRLSMLDISVLLRASVIKYRTFICISVLGIIRTSRRKSFDKLTISNIRLTDWTIHRYWGCSTCKRSVRCIVLRLVHLFHTAA
jgi:hypothetical protein